VVGVVTVGVKLLVVPSVAVLSAGLMYVLMMFDAAPGTAVLVFS